MSAYTYFIPEQYPEFIDTCQKFLSRPEPGTIISPPKNGIMQRVDQLVQDYHDTFAKPLLHIDLGTYCEDMESILELISKKGYTLGKNQLYLLITNASYCLQSKNTRIIDDLVRMQYETKQIKSLFFFESDIFSKEFASLFRQTHIFSQVYYYPLYDIKDSERFISYSAWEWSMKKPPSAYVKKISSLCRGQMWLLRHALREYRENPDIDVDTLIELPETKFRLEKIASSFSDEEILALTGKKDSSDQTMCHLTNLHMLDHGHCSIPILYDYLLKKSAKKTLEWKQDAIYCNTINLKHSFTIQETAVLQLLIQKKNQPVTRDTVANVLWREQVYEKYSPWAIEQVIRRIRKKLADIGFDPKIIHTVQGVGYSYIDLKAT